MGYWENRQAQMMYESMEDAEAVSQELADIYAKASRELNYRIQNIYEKFRDKHGLTDEEAKALLNTLHDSTDLDELRRALKNTSATDPARAELLKQLESPAYRARIERLEQLQTEIDRMMKDVYDQEKKISTDHYVDLATNSYYREIYEIQRQAGFQFSFSAVDPQQLNRILASTWSGANYSERIWGNTQGLAKELKEQMIIGLLTGKREDEMAHELANKYGTGAFQARRLVRTESNFVNGQMQRAAYEDCDADLYDFVAVLDLRTSEICRSLDGQTFRVEDMEPGKNCNPMHPFCRSTTTIHLDDETLAGLKRRARNPITGKNELIPASTNYEKWYKDNVANNPKAQAAEKMIKNRGSDQKQYERYKETLGSKAGKTFEQFQDMKYNDPEIFDFTKLDYTRRNTLAKHPERALPTMEKLDLPDQKFTKYLFGGENEKGLAKGRAFTDRLGYSADEWKKLQREIKKGSSLYPSTVKGTNDYGTLYEQKMVLYGKNGTPANVVVGWIKDDAAGTMRMTSAYIKEV